MTQDQLDIAIQNRREREKAHNRYIYAKNALDSLDKNPSAYTNIDQMVSLFHIERDDAVSFVRELCQKAKTRCERLDEEFAKL